MIFSEAPNDWLMHHGIKGQKWGIRRYQNPDGTLTAEGRKRYGLNDIAKPKNIGNLSKRERRRLALKEYNKMADKQSKFDDELYEEYGNNKTAVKQMDKLSKDAFKQGIKAINEIYDVDLNKTFMARRALALASLASIATVAVAGKFMYNRTTNERILNKLDEQINNEKTNADNYREQEKEMNRLSKESLNEANENRERARRTASYIEWNKEDMEKLHEKYKKETDTKERLKLLSEMTDKSLDNNDLVLEKEFFKSRSNTKRDEAFNYAQQSKKFKRDADSSENKYNILRDEYDYYDKHPYRIKRN